ncbi:MAG: DNA methyltransferase [Vampirovibrionales bacterium]|nr:DNA methyltransferase [Vampirovibrionales bacterium]
MKTLRSPKQKPANQARKSLRYYAAYSEGFVEDVIRSLKLPKDAVILDPWNGSGTTTLVASRLKFNSIGFDLNPAVSQMAYSRLASMPDMEKAITTVKKAFIKSHSKQLYQYLGAFEKWFDEQSISHLSALRAAIHKSSNDSIVLGLIDTAICTGLREQLTAFKTKNPSWLRFCRSHEKKISLDIALLEETTIGLIGQCTPQASNSLKPLLQTKNIIESGLQSASVDAVITSPPYCTRIDYGIATVIELAWLGLGINAIQDLRLQMTGTPRVRKETFSANENLPFSVKELLEAIETHPSKASKSYYLKTYHQFFNDMYLSFEELHRVIKPQGSLCVVVQDSFYKDVHVKLPALLEAILETIGFEILGKTPYIAGGLNFIHGNNTVNEVALTFQKKA